MVILKDTGNGFFEPIRGILYSYDKANILKTPNEEEIKWIKSKCRYNPHKNNTKITGVYLLG